MNPGPKYPTESFATIVSGSKIFHKHLQNTFSWAVLTMVAAMLKEKKKEEPLQCVSHV